MKFFDSLGALDQATGLLSDLGVNILFSDCAPSGYRQATFSSICELQKVRLRATQILAMSRFDKSSLFPAKESVTGDNSLNLERKFQEIGTILLLNLAILQARLRIIESKMFEQRKTDSSKKTAFLHSRAVETGPQPWYVTAATVDAIADLISAGNPISIGAGILSAQETAEFSSIFKDLQETLTTRVHSRGATKGRLTQEAIDARACGTDLKSFIRHYLQTTWRNHWVEPISLRGLLTLAYQRVWSTPPLIEFLYDEKRKILRYDGETAKNNFFEIISTSPNRFLRPTLAIASMHRHDRFIRLRFLERNADDRLIAVNVNYRTWRTISPRDIATNPSSPTKGLLHDVAHSLASQGVNLLRLKSQASEFNPDIENGNINFVGLLPDGPAENPHEKIKSLEEVLNRSAKKFNEASAQDFPKTYDVSVRPFPRRKLFLSMPHDAIRGDEITKEATIAAENNGFLLVQAKTDTDNVTEEVVESVRKDDAMLQIYVLKEIDSSASEGTQDFQWLWAEYGLALMRDIPVLRLKDEKIPASSSERTRPRIHQDRPIFPFSTQKNLSQSLRPLIEKFLLDIPVATAHD